MIEDIEIIEKMVECQTITLNNIDEILEITKELGGEPTRTHQPMVEFIIEQMVQHDRALFIDEIDHVVRSSKMMHLLRDIHDTTNIPIVMIGEEKTTGRIKQYPQIANRIHQWVNFEPLTLEDIFCLSETISEVAVSESLLNKLLNDTSGNMRMAADGLSKIEDIAKAKKLESVGLEDWGTRKFVFGQS